MVIDTQLLREQITFLDTYPWQEGSVPEVVDGVIVLLETILDKEEGYGR